MHGFNTQWGGGARGVVERLETFKAQSLAFLFNACNCGQILCPVKADQCIGLFSLSICYCTYTNINTVQTYTLQIYWTECKACIHKENTYIVYFTYWEINTWVIPSPRPHQKTPENVLGVLWIRLTVLQRFVGCQELCVICHQRSFSWRLVNSARG